MKILLTQDVPNLGKAGEVKTVADGYARNYLIRRGMAIPAAQGVLKQAELDAQIGARREARLHEDSQKMATVLEGLALTFRVRAGETEQLYGSITNADIAKALEEQAGTAVDRRKIELEEPIRRLGSYRVTVHLADREVAHIGVIVERQEE